MPERLAQHRWPGLSQDARDPNAQADGQAIEALAPVWRAGWRESYERERGQTGLRKREQAQAGDR